MNRILLLLLIVVSFFSLEACHHHFYNHNNRLRRTIIVDVRTVEEWENDGHATCTVNYPLKDLAQHINTLKTYRKVILVCRTGNRANAAKLLLQQKGIKRIENKGAWQNINCNNKN
jgi:rhodanese-related sulfurtransferase